MGPCARTLLLLLTFVGDLMPELLEITSGNLQTDGVGCRDWRKEKNAAIWCWLFLLVPFGILAACLAIAATPWFLRHDAYPGLAETIGFSLRARNLNCQVLIYGDSTALVAFDPKIIEQQTGLKTCNIAEPAPVHMVIGSAFPLDRYLEHNVSPQVILSMWSPFSPHPTTQPMTHYSPEGVEYALLYHHGTDFWEGLVKHPEWATAFSMFVVKELVRDAASRLHLITVRNSALEATPRDLRAGFWEYDLPPLKACDSTPNKEWLSETEKRRSIEAFRTRYSTTNTKVLVDIGPLPDCIGEKREILHNSAGLYDNRLQILPISDFVYQDVHVTGEAAKVLSAQAADEILDAIHGSKPSTANRTVPDDGLPRSSR